MSQIPGTRYSTYNTAQNCCIHPKVPQKDLLFSSPNSSKHPLFLLATSNNSNTIASHANGGREQKAAAATASVHWRQCSFFRECQATHLFFSICPDKSHRDRDRHKDCFFFSVWSSLYPAIHSFISSFPLLSSPGIESETQKMPEAMCVLSSLRPREELE